jgi:hypothetical protein
MGCHESQPLPLKLQAAPASATMPAAALVSEAKPPPPTRPTFNPKKQLLYDAQKSHYFPRPHEDEERALLTKLFPRRLEDMAGCREVASREEAIAEGLFMAEVPSAAEGFFTRNDLSQKLYLVEVHPCRVATDPRSVGEGDDPVGYVLVVTGQEPLTLDFTDGRRRVSAIADVDQDGLHEVLLVTSTGGYGDPMTYHAALYWYEGDRFVYKDGAWNVSDEESRLYFQPTTPGEMPKIIEKR